MFAIAPQSVTIIVPGEDAPMPTLTFRNDGDDVAKSVLELTTPGNDKHILTFNTRGQLVDQQFVEYVEPEQTVQDEGEPQDHGSVEKVQAIQEPPHETAPDSEKQPA